MHFQKIAFFSTLLLAITSVHAMHSEKDRDDERLHRETAAPSCQKTETPSDDVPVIRTAVVPKSLEANPWRGLLDYFTRQEQRALEPKLEDWDVVLYLRYAGPSISEKQTNAYFRALMDEIRRIFLKKPLEKALPLARKIQEIEQAFSQQYADEIALLTPATGLRVQVLTSLVAQRDKLAEKDNQRAVINAIIEPLEAGLSERSQSLVLRIEERKALAAAAPLRVTHSSEGAATSRQTTQEDAASSSAPIDTRSLPDEAFKDGLQGIRIQTEPAYALQMARTFLTKYDMPAAQKNMLIKVLQGHKNKAPNQKIKGDIIKLIRDLKK